MELYSFGGPEPCVRSSLMSFPWTVVVHPANEMAICLFLSHLLDYHELLIIFHTGVCSSDCVSKVTCDVPCDYYIEQFLYIYITYNKYISLVVHIYDMSSSLRHIVVLKVSTFFISLTLRVQVYLYVKFRKINVFTNRILAVFDIPLSAQILCKFFSKFIDLGLISISEAAQF